MDIWDFFPFFSSEVGYLGLALVSFFGSLIPFVPIPSFILLVTMSVGDQFDIHILAILAAVTATLAKQIIFSLMKLALRSTLPKGPPGLRTGVVLQDASVAI